MDRFKVRIVLAITGTRRETQTSNTATGNISKDITMFIGKHYDIQRLRKSDHPPGQVIYQKFLVTQTGVGLYGFCDNCAETPIGARQNRVLSSKGHTTRIASSLTTQSKFTRRHRYMLYLLIGTDTHSMGTSYFYRGELRPGRAAG